MSRHLSHRALSCARIAALAWRGAWRPAMVALTMTVLAVLHLRPAGAQDTSWKDALPGFSTPGAGTSGGPRPRAKDASRPIEPTR